MRSLFSTAAVVLCIAVALMVSLAPDRGGRAAPERGAVAAGLGDIAGAALLQGPETMARATCTYAYHRELVQEMQRPMLLQAAAFSTAPQAGICGERGRIGPIGRTGPIGRVVEPYGGRWGALGARSAPMWV